MHLIHKVGVFFLVTILSMVKYTLYKPCLSLPINILLLRGFCVQLGSPIYIHVFYNLNQTVTDE